MRLQSGFFQCCTDDATDGWLEFKAHLPLCHPKEKRRGKFSETTLQSHLSFLFFIPGTRSYDSPLAINF